METFYVVDYMSEERKDLFSFLKSTGFKWLNQKELEDEEHCFPLAVDTSDKCVGLTNTFFLKAFSLGGGQVLSVCDLKKVIGACAV